MIQEETARIAQIFGEKRYRDIQQPRLGTKKRTGKKYVESRNRNDFKLTEEELQKKRSLFEAFFQPTGALNIFVPTNTQLFERVMSGNSPMSAYKGVSYNPYLTKFGERLDNIDFFSWAKQVQQVLPDFRFLVLDASAYQVMNEMDPRLLPDRETPSLGMELAGLLQTEFARNQGIRENADLRNAYLLAIAETIGAGEVIDARDALRPDNEFLMQALEDALRYCGAKLGQEFEIERFVKYQRYTGEFSKTYTPLVIAEALWLFDTEDNDLKLGPTSERNFDKMIRDGMRELRGANYLVTWYARDENGLPYEEGIFFSDTSDEVRRKLGNDAYRQKIEGIIEPLTAPGQLEERVLEFMDTVNARVDDIRGGPM